MILAIDTSTAACTAALFDGDGHCVASADEHIGRGHAERLVPMIAELLGGRRARRVIVGVGPGSFTGLRVGIAAAHGLAIGWDAELSGMASMALIAAGTDVDGPVAAVIAGGHGELFVQEFARSPLRATSPILNLPPAEASARVRAPLLAGPAAEQLLAARGSGTAVEIWPSAARALALPDELRSLPPRPLYARAPDARPREAA